MLGLRTLAYAYKDIKIGEWEELLEKNNGFESEKDRENIEKDLTFVITFALNDDLREGVPEAIKKL